MPKKTTKQKVVKAPAQGTSAEPKPTGEIKAAARPSPSVDHASPPVNNQPLQNTTDLELAALDELDSKLLVAKDRIGMVARFETPGFYWHGRPGTGKTHTVLATLDEMRVKYVYHKGSITPQGLLELMEAHSDEVIVLDDVSAIFGDKKAVQYLLAALGRLQGRAVEMGYIRQGRSHNFKFTGGIICISNLAVEDKGMLAAFRSRVHTLGHEPSDLMLIGLARHRICKNGWPLSPTVVSKRSRTQQKTPKPKKHTQPKPKPHQEQATTTPEPAKPALPADRMAQPTPPENSQPVQVRQPMTADDCNLVIDWIWAESRRLNVNIDLRVLFDKALPDFRAWREGKTKAHWKDLVTTTLQQEVGSLAYTPPGGINKPGVRQATKEQEQEIVLRDPR